jgi:hypothetical protein
MKIKVNAILSGEEIIQNFLKQLKENNIDPDMANVQLLVYSENKKQDIEIKPENLKIIFNKE